jgi:ribokinase
VATALVTVARLGGQVCLQTAVGDDAYGQRIIAELQAEGVATDNIQVVHGDSHVAFVLAEPGKGRRTIWWHNDRRVLDGCVPSKEVICSARALHIDTHLLDAALQAATWMHEAGGIVMIDAERPSEAAVRLLPLCDYMVVSEPFSQAITGEKDLSVAAQVLQQRYGGVAVVTAGEYGSWCCDGDAPFRTPAFPVTAVDTTGAGDVFHGSMLYALLRGDVLQDALRFASATAALKCRAPGGRAGIPTLVEVERLMNR